MYAYAYICREGQNENVTFHDFRHWNPSAIQLFQSLSQSRNHHLKRKQRRKEVKLSQLRVRKVNRNQPKSPNPMIWMTRSSP